MAVWLRGSRFAIFRACLLGLYAVALGEVAGAEAGAAGFRTLDSRHLTLVTDLPASDEIDELPRLFDAAFDSWCRYFSVNAKQHADWHVTGYLMQAKERFQQAGFWRSDLPSFPNGFSTGEQLWLYDQTSPYYRRHLLLHEGVHSFMYLLVGKDGPPWYLEGIAELLATHRWEDGQLRVGCFPATRQEMQAQGRIKIVQDDFAASQPLSVADVLAYKGRAQMNVEAYGWSWALVAFLDGHPRYHARFRQVADFVRGGKFESRFRELFEPDWQRLADEWQVFVANLDYGYDFERMAIDFQPGEPLPADGSDKAVAADRGWQASGVRLEAGKEYRLRASGRYQVAQEPAAWWCEPGGITIRYYHGQPLGILLAAVHPDPALAANEPAGEKEASAPPLVETFGHSGLAYPSVVGLETVLAPQQGGTLYLRINESAAVLADNAGELTVEIRESKKVQGARAQAQSRAGKISPGD